METRARQAAWLGFLTLLAAAGLVWLGLALGGAGPRLAGARAAGELAPRSASTDLEAGDPANGALAAPDAISAAGADRAAAASGAPELAIDPDLEYVVRVVRADSGAALPFATLRVWPQIGIDWTEYWYQYATVSDPYERRSRGRRDLVCDEHGRVVVARTKASCELAARADGWIGFAGQFEPGEREFVIRCHPDRAMDVRVVDSARQPVKGAWVSLRDRDDEYSYPIWIGCTDAAGSVRCEHAQALMAPYEGQSPLAFGLAHPFLQLVEQRVDPKALPSEPVELVMPPAGMLEVQWVDEQGRVLDLRGSIDVSCDTDPEIQGAYGIRTLQERGYDSLAVEHGRVEIACAPNGRRVDLSSYPVGGWSELGEDSGIELPSRPGQRVEKRIVLKRDGRRIRGRVLDPAGVPIADAELDVRYDSLAGVPRGHGRARTEASDPDGHFDFHHDEAPEPCTLVLGWTSPQRHQFSGRAPLPRIEAGATHDCGELRLEPTLPLSAGRVVDAAGQPVVRAVLEVSVFEEGQYIGHHDHGRSGRIVTSVHTDKHGRFALPTPALDLGRYSDELRIDTSGPHGNRVRTNAAMLLITPPTDVKELSALLVPLPVGAQDLRYVLPAGSRLHGRLEVPPDRNFRDFGLLAVQQAPAPGAQFPQRHWTRVSEHASAPPGAFDFGTLEPGLWRVEVWDSRYTLELVRVEDVVVAPNAAGDPRLDPLVVPAEFDCVSIELVDPDGRAIVDGAIAVLDPAHGPDAWSRIVRREYEPGRYWVWSRHFPIDLEACCPGAAPQRARGVESDTQIVLLPGLRLELHLPNLEAGTQVELECSWIDPDEGGVEMTNERRSEIGRGRSPWAAELSATVGGPAPGPFVVHVPSAGRWKVEGRIRDGEKRTVLVDSAGAAHWTVEVGGNGVVLDLQVAPRVKTD
jgi:hypothetical protein